MLHGDSSKDNVAVAFEHIEAGDDVSIEVKGSANQSIKAVEEIPFGFKRPLVDIPKRAYVVKYGEVMGCATSDISKSIIKN